MIETGAEILWKCVLKNTSCGKDCLQSTPQAEPRPALWIGYVDNQLKRR